MAKAQELLYAVVGVGDLAVEKVRSFDRRGGQKAYEDLVERGRALSTKVRNSAPTTRAVEQTRSARAHVKGAATSVTKAVRADAKATSNAAKRTGTKSKAS